jgi:fucose permease
MIALGSLGAATVPWLVGAISSRTGSLSSGLSALLVLLAVLVVLHVLRVKAGCRALRRRPPSTD